VRAASPNSRFHDIKRILREQKLHTVCEEASCPNIAECFGKGTATFMILGDICTRACGYCAVGHGRPHAIDTAEPARVADAVQKLDLAHVVVTSVDRDDVADGGASIFAETVREIRKQTPKASIEVLIPDFQGSHPAMDIVMYWSRGKPFRLAEFFCTSSMLWDARGST